jgi:hypothetical protein
VSVTGADACALWALWALSARCAGGIHDNAQRSVIAGLA